MVDEEIDQSGTKVDGDDKLELRKPSAVKRSSWVFLFFYIAPHHQL